MSGVVVIVVEVIGVGSVVLVDGVVRWIDFGRDLESEKSSVMEDMLTKLMLYF